MGPEVGPALRSRGPLPFLLGARLAETVPRHAEQKNYIDLGIPAFAPRSEPPHTRAPGAQMIRVASGSSLAFQRLPRDSPIRGPNVILSVRLASGDLNFENGTGAQRDREQVGQTSYPHPLNPKERTAPHQRWRLMWPQPKPMHREVNATACLGGTSGGKHTAGHAPAPPTKRPQTGLKPLPPPQRGGALSHLRPKHP
eukprot:gene16075-biopygen21766